MSSNDTTVASVYRYVIDDVINQVRVEFENSGYEAALDILQKTWEANVAQSRVANFTIQEDYANEGATSVDGYPMYPSNVAGGQGNRAPYNLLTSTLNNANDLHNPSNGQYASIAAPSSSTSSYQNLQQGSRPNIPQNDGTNDELTTEQIDAYIAQTIHQRQENSDNDTNSNEPFTITLSGNSVSLDSLPENIQQYISDFRAQRTSKPGRSRIAQLDGDGDEYTGDAGNENNEDEINSDLDSHSEGDAEDEDIHEHIILCLYDKVTRTKNKWKCVLKDGIMLINGRDYLFHRANGDFEW